MARLDAQFSPAFQRDVKRLKKKHIDDQPLAEVIDLIIENSPQALEKLRNRHNMHMLWRKMARKLRVSCLQCGRLAFDLEKL